MSETDRSLTKQEREITAFEKVAEEFDGLSLTLNVTPPQRLFRLADAMNQLDAALTPAVMAPIMKLMGSRVGFKTDKDKNNDGSKGPGYSEAIVKEVVKEAILYGAYMTGNEVNVIAGGMYATKEHFMRKVREIRGLTDLEVTIGAPQVSGSEAKIKCAAKWRLNGVEQSIGYDDKFPCNFLVRVYDGKGGGADQAVGKATRKLYKRIYETATGSKISVPDGDAYEQARDADAKIVDRATVNLDDIKPGDADTHNPVDTPLNGNKKSGLDFTAAYAKLSAIYPGREREIDDALFRNGASEDLIALQGTTDAKAIKAVIKTAEEVKA